jgi:hypothetical protein
MAARMTPRQAEVVKTLAEFGPAEAGTRLGISKSRVCEIAAQARRKVAGLLGT